MKDIFQLHENLLSFVLSYFEKAVTIPHRTFYAETFLLSWLQKSNALTPNLKKTLLASYLEKDRTDLSFHFEFNHFATLEFIKAGGSNHFEKDLRTLNFRGTTCANWSLLRSLVKFRVHQGAKALKEMKATVKKFQLESGFIEDEANSLSLQYHCFSMSLILDMYLESRNDFFKEKFLAALNFITHFIMPDGEISIIGRGQNQIFGHGPLLISLLWGHKFTGDPRYLSLFSLVCNSLKRHQHSDGRFSLVLTNNDEPLSDINLKDETQYGQYGYNNVFDYLAFLGSYLNRCVDFLKLNNELTSMQLPEVKFKDYRDDRFEVNVRESYIAILTRPGGAWSNDLPVPYIFNLLKNKAVTPIYGGEQYLPSLYRLEGLPYPTLKIKRLHMRKRGIARFMKHGWIWFSPFGVLVRQFEFNPNKIVLKNKVLSFFGMKDRYLFFKSAKKVLPHMLESEDIRIVFKRDVFQAGTEFCAKGAVTAWDSESVNPTLEIEVL